MRRGELMKIMNNKSSDKKEKTILMEKVRRKYDTKKKNQPHGEDSAVDLSTNAASSKFHREKETLFGQVRAKGGDTRVSYAQKDTDENPTQTYSKSIDEQRREELQAIIRDKSLSRDERKHKMQEVKSRFAMLEETQSSYNTTRRREAKANLLAALEAYDEDLRIDLSAKSYATKKTQELDTIRNAQGGSLHQRKAASKNETMKAGSRTQVQPTTSKFVEVKGKCVKLFLSS